MKRSLSEINLSRKGKVAVPDVFHFVWVGDVNRINTDYIDVWRNVNRDKKICFWYDDSALLINEFHKLIHEYALSSGFESISELEMKVKNESFDYFFPKLKSGCSFDTLVIGFLEERGIPCQSAIKPQLNPWLKGADIEIRSIMQLFAHGFSDFFKYYCYEIILRGNLASASDIVRLLIIYTQGGVYIDVDTLPYTDHLFHRTNQYLKENNIIEDDLLLQLKTEAVLREVSIVSRATSEMVSSNVSHQENKNINYEFFSELIEADMVGFSLPQITPLGSIYVHKNLLLLGSLKKLKGIYFNNVICSHSGSKVIRIILRAMRRRYIYLEQNNCIFNFCSNSHQNSYLSRILSWRSELITKRFCVTPVLTGPGLIVEVLLALAYVIFDLDTSVTPDFIAEYMQDEELGIAFYQHNIDTPEGMSSVWRK